MTHRTTAHATRTHATTTMSGTDPALRMGVSR
jgi:hypothetical protein